MQLPSAANTIGLPFVELQSVDSTNKYAMSLVHEAMAQHGMAVFAHEQTAGRGQRGKNWSSEKDSSIALSIITNPYPLRVSETFRLSACMAVALHEFFSQYAGNETKIKWPNDIYWRDRKAGGVLIENAVQSRGSGVGSQESGIWKWAVIGIGININQTAFPPDLPNPASLKQIAGKNFDPVELAKELCIVLDKYFQLLIAGNFEPIFKIYQTILYKKDEQVKLKKGNRIFETTIKGVAETGQLIIQHAIEERFEFGEVEWIL